MIYFCLKNTICFQLLKQYINRRQWQIDLSSQGICDKKRYGIKRDFTAKKFYLKSFTMPFVNIISMELIEKIDHFSAFLFPASHHFQYFLGIYNITHAT